MEVGRIVGNMLWPNWWLVYYYVMMSKQNMELILHLQLTWNMTKETHIA